MTKIFKTRSDRAIPIFLSSQDKWKEISKTLPKSAAAYAAAVGFKGQSGKLIMAAGSSGAIETVILGLGAGDNPFICGTLVTSLPSGTYAFADQTELDPTLMALGMGLDSYVFDQYLDADDSTQKPNFVWPKGCDRTEITEILKGVFLTRDLINVPANDMGPNNLADAASKLGEEFGAKVAITKGEQLLAQNFPLIHAVGRASTQAPCLIDMTWGKANAPKVTIIGKGVCYDTGGLSIKPTAGMLLMKKDMAGGANALGLASMIMARKLNVRLRVIIPAVENSISGNSFRPGDVLRSRKGLSVEIGNTDAEGRLVLADALALADEESPELMIDMATLTGAARVALGVELPAFYCDDDSFVAEVSEAGLKVADPVWRMPLWKPYLEQLSSKIADVSQIAAGPLADSVMAALFLQEFVKETKVWAHIDLMSWNAAAKPGRPFGGDSQTIRALYDVLKRRYT